MLGIESIDGADIRHNDAQRSTIRSAANQYLQILCGLRIMMIEESSLFINEINESEILMNVYMKTLPKWRNDKSKSIENIS